MPSITPMLATAVSALINSVIPTLMISTAYNLLSGNPPIDIIQLLGVWMLVAFFYLTITQLINFWSASKASVDFWNKMISSAAKKGQE